jgi:hypothetical protein
LRRPGSILKDYAEWVSKGRIFATVLMIVDIGLCYLSQMPVPIAAITCTSQLAASPNDGHIPLEWWRTACRIGAWPDECATDPVLARSNPKPRFMG